MFWKFVKRLLLVLVVVVVALIAYVMLHNRVSGPPPDAANLKDLRSLNTALQTYKSAYGHYPDSLAQLGVPRQGPSSEQAAGLIGSKLAAGSIHEYNYTYVKTASGYEIHADPTTADNNVHLYTNQTADIRFNRKKPADGSSPIAQ